MLFVFSVQKSLLSKYELSIDLKFYLKTCLAIIIFFNGVTQNVGEISAITYMWLFFLTLSQHFVSHTSTSRWPTVSGTAATRSMNTSFMCNTHA